MMRIGSACEVLEMNMHIYLCKQYNLWVDQLHPRFNTHLFNRQKSYFYNLMPTTLFDM